MSFLFYLTIFGFVCFVVYNIILICMNDGKIPESVSETSYILQDKSKTGKPSGFTYICLIIAMCFMPYWIFITPDKLQFLVFLCCAGVIFAGSTPFFREGFEKPIHYISGGLSALTYILWFILFGGWYWLLGVLGAIGLSMLIKGDLKEYVYWIEIYGVIFLMIKFILQ